MKNIITEKKIIDDCSIKTTLNKRTIVEILTATTRFGKEKVSKSSLISKKARRAVQETAYLLAIPGMKKSIQRGMKTPIEKCVKELKIKAEPPK